MANGIRTGDPRPRGFNKGHRNLLRTEFNKYLKKAGGHIRVNLRVTGMKGHATLSRYPELEHHQIQFSIISWTPFWWRSYLPDKHTVYSKPR